MRLIPVQHEARSGHSPKWSGHRAVRYRVVGSGLVSAAAAAQPVGGRTGRGGYCRAVPEDSIDRMVDEWAARDPRLDVSALQVVGRLFRCAAHGQRAIADALRQLGLSYGDFDVLNTLRRRNDPDGTNPRDLARTALITSGAMTTRLDRLERTGLIERRPDPKDRRAVLIHLTPAGEEVAAQALDAVLAADETFLKPLSPKQRDALAASLKVLLLHSEADG